MARKVRLTKVTISAQNAGVTPQSTSEEEASIFDENDKLLLREVNGEENRRIRVGRNEDGKKYRYTDDTHEELVTKTTEGKNTYLTKAEFDRQVKEILQVDYIPDGIRPEFRDGCIVFINESTGLTMSSAELKSHPGLLTAQNSKKFNEEFSKRTEELIAQSGTLIEPKLPLAEIDKPIVLPIVEPDTKPTIDESSMKIDPNWYTEDGVRSLMKEWGSIATRSKGFNQQFYQGIVDIAREALCDPNDLMALINAESSFIPNQRTGLMGFVGITQAKYSFTPSRLSPVKQLPYIRQCLLDSKEMAFGKDSNHALSAGELYSIIFVPGYVKGALKDPKHILVSKRSNNPQKRSFYNNPININLDKDKKGYITIEDLAQRLQTKNAYNTSRKMGIAYNGDRFNPNGTPVASGELLASATPPVVEEPVAMNEMEEQSIEELRKEYPNLIQEVTITGSLSKVKKGKLLSKGRTTDTGGNIES